MAHCKYICKNVSSCVLRSVDMAVGQQRDRECPTLQRCAENLQN